MKPSCIAISGSDPSCGAGAQLDIRVMELFSVRPLNVISGITVQNGDKVFDVFSVPKNIFKSQLENVLNRNSPIICKIGMLTLDALAVVEDFISLSLLNIPIVLDPILKSSSGFTFIEKENYGKIFSKSFLVTPNIPEIELFVDMQIESYADVVSALNIFSEKFLCERILLKGGHLKEFLGTDFLFENNKIVEISGKKHWQKEDIHGTGCFLSTAIASCLANGLELEQAVRLSKEKLV